MSFVKEFKDFAAQGSMVDMAVGIVIGAAVGKIIAALVGGIILPIVGYWLGGVNFTDLAIELAPALEGKDAVLIKWGEFLQTIFDFLIIAFVVFIMVRFINKLKKAEEEAPAAPPREEVLLEEIRDLLKK